MNLQKLLTSREGQRRIISRQLEKFNHELSISEKTALLEIMEEKAELIKNLNEKILNHADIGDLESELVDSEEYSIDLRLKLRKLREDIAKSSDTGSGSVIRDSQDVNGSAQTISGENLSNYSSCSRRVPPDSSSFHRLPKLSLPTFDGDVAKWQSFWDSYEAAVHLNQTLSDVQKFNYLRSLLENTAYSAIDGFPLTNANYKNAIDLLHERFGQSHKIIDSYMQSLLDLPIPNNSVTSLRSFHDRMENYIRGLESLGECQGSYGDLLVPIIMKKLPSELRRNLAREHGNVRWQIQDLRSAIAREINILEAGVAYEVMETHMPTASLFTGTEKKKSTVKKQSQTRDNYKSKKLCVFCEGEHSSHSCEKVKTHEEKLNIIRSKRLCYNCLGKHPVSECRSKFRCRHCQRKHHSSICEKSSTSGLNPNAASFVISTSGQTGTAILHSTTHQKSNVLLKTAIAQVSSQDFSMATANILFDEGAQRSFVTEELAKKLKLKHTGSDTISLASFGGKSEQCRHIPMGRVFIHADHGETIPLDVLIVPTIAVPLPYLQREVKCLKYIEGLKLAHPISAADDDFEISLLIGADHFWQIVQNKVIRGNGPTAVKSKLGYLLSGPLSSTKNESSASYMLNVITAPPNVEDLERFWKLESMGICEDESEKSTSGILETYKENSITYKDGRYTAKLPWKEDHPVLPTNYEVCRRRTENTIRRLSSEPDLLQQYGQIIEDQLKRGFIEKCDTNVTPSHPVHYIPHHHVKKDSNTTPIRIVYDCSCKSRDQPSLNDCLMSTPPELNDLTGILLRFRMNRYAIATDIEKAFLNIALDEKDRDVTRFLWLSDNHNPNSDLTTYRFRTVLFGATSSPFILCATILKHLEIHKDKKASEYLRKDLYVDNVISSFQQEDELLQFYNESRELMSSAGFNLRSWSSNSEKLRIQASNDLVLDKAQSPKVLGMKWDPDRDILLFPVSNIISTKTVTKREILQNTSRIYDPLGLLSPVTIRAKILLQELWQQKFEWDAPLPENIQEKWRCLVTDLNSVTATTFPRHYFENTSRDPSNTCIHIFCDASLVSYGATAYICRENQSTLMMAKTRVAPLKRLTLPRLELLAAVTGSRLCKHIQQNTGIRQIHLWSDSQIVLSWLQTSKTLQRFVRNRVTEIHALTETRKWKYCPTKDNPADLLTRGISASQFKNSSLWFHGPTWISTPDNWPVWQVDTYVTMATITDPVNRQDDTTTLPQKNISFIDVSRFSSLTKLLRVTAYVLRFINNCRGRRQNEPLSTDELRRAEELCIRSCQMSKYQEEMTDISTEKNKLPLCRQLKLFMENGILKCRGRIHNAPLDELTKFPYLLPAKHPFTNLVVNDAHSRLLHAGASSTITFLRQKYWIPSIRQTVKTILRKCTRCMKVIGRPYSAPDPPPLPKSRVSDVNPFTYTGVDFSGALLVRDNNRREMKAYICLFTCATTRAIHLELVPDLSAESFLQAFRRFCSRKSVPHVMMSDNANTFISASKQLQDLFKSTTVRQELNNRGIEWKMIPKRAPWFGGMWERLIGLTKTTIKKVLGRSYVTYETLQTIITEIEAMINDRPLTYVSCDTPDEPEVLTPSHLLYGRRISKLPYEENQPTDPVTTDRSSIIKRFTMQTNLINHFRDRWRHEYLTALRERHQTTGKNDQTISIGDVVLVHDDAPRLLWKLAVVEELVKGNDGLIRSAKIRTQNGLTNRAIVKLYPLEVY
jgi:transposase InsO family protein